MDKNLFIFNFWLIFGILIFGNLFTKKMKKKWPKRLVTQFDTLTVFPLWFIVTFRHDLAYFFVKMENWAKTDRGYSHFILSLSFAF